MAVTQVSGRNRAGEDRSVICPGVTVCLISLPPGVTVQGCPQSGDPAVLLSMD